MWHLLTFVYNYDTLKTYYLVSLDRVFHLQIFRKQSVSGIDRFILFFIFYILIVFEN